MRRELVLFVATSVVIVAATEVVLSYYFFHRRSPHPFALVHYAAHAIEAIQSRRTVVEPKIYSAHPLLGYAHRPSARGVHTTPSFSVVYSTDEAGDRPTPDPDRSLGDILLLGDSFTFGYGVGDTEAFPHVLSTRYWPDWKIVNRGVNGWATSHSYIVLAERVNLDETPSVVIYSMIPDDVCRNYLRKTWLEMLAASGRAHPHFELVDGRLRFMGLTDAQAAQPDERVLREKELSLTRAFIAEMKRLTERDGGKFFLVLLPQRHEAACGTADWPPALVRDLVSSGVELVDLTDLEPHMTWLDPDVHPDARGHALLAEGVFRSRITDELGAMRGSPRPQ